jgi:SAM-dependent methyltransferase
VGVERALSFGQVAELYDRRRPGYPEPLYDEVLRTVPGVRRVLEAGAGTGKATTALASRGLEIEALEPDPAMAAVARERTRGLAVHVRETRLEDYDPPPAGFDLVACAQAWHWVDAARGGAVAAQALRPGGALAVWWNRPGTLDEPVWVAIHAAYRREAPELADTKDLSALSAGSEEDRVPTTRFDGWVQHTYEWTQRYSSTSYGELIQTHSNHRLLPEPQLARLVAAVRRAIDDVGDGTVDYPYRTHLWLARQP